MTDRLLKLDEAARVLCCSVRTLRRRIAAGALPVFRDGRLVRVPERALIAYVTARTLGPQPQGERAVDLLSARRGSGRRARSLFDEPDPLASFASQRHPA
jgi:excisionase family DNA binding protein